MHKKSYGILCNSCSHLIKHVITHHLILDNRISLSKCLKTDTLL